MAAKKSRSTSGPSGSTSGHPSSTPVHLKNKKNLGQHWLKNRAILDQIASLAGTGPLCLEIGPGLGTLTASLLKRFTRVVAVEFDPDLARNLPRSFPGTALEVHHADILDFDLTSLGPDYVVVGNIPYYITSPILKKVLSTPVQPQKVVLLVQKEVAERIANERETLLSLWVKNRAAVSLGPVVPRGEFTPPPQVDSQVIVLTPHAPEVPEELFDLIRQGFVAPRKKLLHNLTSVTPPALRAQPTSRTAQTHSTPEKTSQPPHLHPLSRDQLKQLLTDLQISPNARPGDLHLTDWQKLATAWQKVL